MVNVSGKVSSKRQFTLPIQIMRQLNIKPGDTVRFVVDKGEQYCKIVPESKTLHPADLHKHFQHLTTIKATDMEIRKAREKAYTEKF